MWKREETAPSVSPSPPVEEPVSKAVARQPTRREERDVVTIGKSIVIKGELSGSEDLTIEGNIEGKIELKQHVLTIGSHGRIRAQIFAKEVVVLGEVVGNVQASEKVVIRDNGMVEGDLVAPRVAIAEGARFRGGIDMQPESGTGAPSGETRPAGGGRPAQAKVRAKGGAATGRGQGAPNRR